MSSVLFVILHVSLQATQNYLSRHWNIRAYHAMDLLQDINDQASSRPSQTYQKYRSLICEGSNKEIIWKNIVYKRLLPLVTPFHHSCNWLAVRWRLQKNQDNQSFRKLIHFGLECRRATYLLQKYVISSPSENTGVGHSKSIWKVNTFIEILPALCVTSLALNTGSQYLPHFQRPGFPFYSRSWIEDVEHKEHLLNSMSSHF